MKRLFFFICICFACVLTAQAVDYSDKTKYLSKGDTVTIRQDGGMYLAVDDRGTTIIAHGEPNDNALWRIVWCLYKQESGWDQSQYQFQHVKTKKYLYVDAGASGRNNYYANLALIDNNNPSLFIENNPTGEEGSYETASEMHYNHATANKSYHLTVDKNAWKLQQNKKTNIQIEKWEGHSNISFGAYFSPEAYEFGLVKDTYKDAQGNELPADDESIVQTKKIRFVVDLRDSTYMTCVRPNITNKKLLEKVVEERDLDKLIAEYSINPTFQWSTSGNATSTLAISADGYTSTVEMGRTMMTFTEGGISTDKLAWELSLNALGKSPMGLKRKHNNAVETWDNYVDYLKATWTYNNKTYTHQLRVMRKSYHTEELPEFEFTVSPSTYTFDGDGGDRIIQINGFHQHGMSYFDADNRLVERVYTYPRTPIPLQNFDVDKDGKNDLEVSFTCTTLDDTTKPVDWLHVKDGSITSNSVIVTADRNEAAYRRARLYGTFTLTKGSDGQAHEHSGVVMPIINQRKVGVGNMKLKHYEGIAEDAVLDPKTGRQQVHTTERTIYYTPNQEVQLQLAESEFYGYMRWFEYHAETGGGGGDPYWNTEEKDRTSWVVSPRGGNGTAFRAINTGYGESRGLYGTNNKNGDNSGRDPQGGPLTRDSENKNAIPVLKGWNYTAVNKEGTIDPNAYHTMACDVSAYTDYQVWYTGDRRDAIQEPTLSYRQLFHFKPAEEIARELCAKSHMSPGQFLENYKYLAERGTDMHLATNFRYAKYSHESELCYFFFDKKENLMRVGKDAQAQWYRINLDANGNESSRTTITNPNYAVKDFLRVDADYDGTVIYELRVPKDRTSKTDNPLDHDILIARFEITIVQDGSCGPVGGNGLMSTHEMNEHYQLLEHIDFSFGAPAPGTTDLRQLNKHLPWTESTYGYYYPKEDGEYADKTNVDYSVLGKTSSNRADQHIPYYGEYFLINKINKEWARAEQHGGAENGYALYVDGTTEPGRVISISTKAKICAGQTLYCSAWVCNPNPSTNDGRIAPIFRFNVEGREKDIDGNWGEWEDVSVYFAGTLAANSGWQQIVFPVLSDKSYDETRVSLYNFATGGNGNDFMVDDISLFVSRLPLASYQAQTNCSSEANTESSTAVILRIDYTDFQGEKDQYMYYQIFKEKNTYDKDDTAHPIRLQYTTSDNSAYFHDNTADKDANEYGSVRIPTQNFDPEVYNSTAEANDKVLIFQTVQGFKDYLVDRVQKQEEKSTHAKAYIKTTDSRGQSKWLIYVMHIVPNAKERDENGNPILASDINENKYLRECYHYSLRMANVPEELAAPECNLQTPLHATQATHFDLRNGDQELVEQGFIPLSLDNCANDYYTLTSVIENVMAITTGGELDKVRGEVLSDWLVGHRFDSVYANTKIHEAKYQEAVRQAEKDFFDTYGYTRAQVKTAILYDLRRQDTLNTNLMVDKFENLDPQAFADPFNYTVIKHLHDNGWLQLRKPKTSFYLASLDTVRYWVYPIDGTASATYANQTVVLQDCTEPIWVTVTSEHSDHVLNIAPVPNADKTDAQKRQIPTVRVLQSTLTNNDYITIPITDIKQAKSTIGDDDDTQIKFKLSDLNENIHFVDSITGQKIDAPTTFEIGKKYLMRMRFADNGGQMYVGGVTEGCRVGTIYFRLLILPNRVVWAPITGIYDGWGLDGNWRGWDDKNNNGQIDNDELTEGYVPMAGSDVIIGNVPKADGVTLPTLEISEHYPYVHDHNHYPMDVHAHASTCGRIYFAPGAHIHNQHLLNYEKAFVDMLLPAGKWNTVSVPLQNVYASGDFFIPHPNNSWWNSNYDNLESANPFEVKGFSGRRHQNAAYAFWPAFYNQTTTKHYEGTKGIVEQAASADFVQSNTLSEQIKLGSGFSIYGLGPGNNGNEGDLIVRLPKPDESYYYYTQSGEVSVNNTGTLDRTNSGKFAFTATKNAPKMEITLTNSVSGNNQSFLFGNPTMAYIDMYALLKDNEGKWSSFSYVTGSQWNATTTLLPSDRFLPPMTSVMLNTNSDVKELKVILKPEHLTLTNTEIPLLAPRPSASIRKNSAPEDERPVNNAALATEMMTIFASTSSASARTVLATNPAANDYYQIGEDALFISTGVENQSAVTTPLNMYTVAEQVPMMADVRQGISEIPLGMLVANGYRTTHMQVAFHLSANWTRTCYFCDSKTGQKIRIMDGLVISVEMPQDHEQRYFIEGPDQYIGSGEGGVTTSTSSIKNPSDATLRVYSLSLGEVTVSASELMREVKLYDMAGRLIGYQMFGMLQHTTTLSAPAGVCIVEAILQDGTSLHAQTIVR